MSATTEARRQSMKVYYDKKASDINRNRLLQRIESGKQNGIQRSVLSKYDWSPEERALLEPLVNEKVVRQRKTKQPAAGSTFATVKFTKDDFEAAIIADPRTTTTASKNQWRIVFNNFKRMFDTIDDAFTDFLLKTDDQIFETLKNAYPNPTTLIKQAQFVNKLYNIMGNHFQTVLTEARYDVWNKLQKNVADSVTVYKNSRKEDTSTNTDYAPMFVDMFKKELELRKKPGTVQHALSMLYTVGVYEDLSKINQPTFVPRIDYDDVFIVDNDAQMTNAKGKYYNLNSGRLVINELKTQGTYTYDYRLNPIAKKYLNEYIVKLKKKPGDPLFVKSKLTENVKKALGGVGNREYRKCFQNIYHKVIKVPLESMSAPMAHDASTALESYIDGYKYTETERKAALKNIKEQLELNFAQ